MTKKKDLIPLALYQIMAGKYKRLRLMQKELEEHLEKNYEMREDNWGFEDFISDRLYGEEEDAEEFVKDLNELTREKDG